MNRRLNDLSGDSAAENARRLSNDGAAPKIYRSFRCPRCRTAISVLKNEVGTTVVCPDCDSSLVVPDYLDFTETEEERRRAARASGATTRRAELVSPLKNPNREGIDFAKEGVYAVDEGKNPEARKKYARENMFPVRCKVCRALLYATRDELERPIRCPDCGTETVATDALRKQFDFEETRNDLNASVPANSEYVAESPAPKLTDLTYRRFLRKIGRLRKRPKVERPDAYLPLVLRRRGDSFVWALASPPKKFPLFNGVFRALATNELWARAGIVVLMAVGIAVLWAGELLPAIKVYRDNPFPNNPLWELKILAVCGIFIPLLGVFWATAGTFATSVFAAGSCGARRAVEWRDEDPLGYVAFGAWFFLMIAAALAPGMGAAAIVEAFADVDPNAIVDPNGAEAAADSASRWLSALLTAGSFWLIFPIFWLSTLELDAFFAPIAREVCASFWRLGRYWLQFYAASAALLGVPLTLFIRYFKQETTWTYFPFALPLVAILYALLLGRFAWILDDEIRKDDYDD